MRRKVTKKAVCLFLLLGIAGIGSTAAYYTAYDRQDNEVAVGKNVTEIVEEFPGPTPTPRGEDFEYKKIVTVTNSSYEQSANVDCYVRVLISYSNSDIGNAVSLLGMNEDKWIYDSTDGYYYYVESLGKGETTVPLFTGFLVESSKVDKQYIDEIEEFHINVYEESIQKGDFTDYLSAWSYYLNPVTN